MYYKIDLYLHMTGLSLNLGMPFSPAIGCFTERNIAAGPALTRSFITKFIPNKLYSRLLPGLQYLLLEFDEFAIQDTIGVLPNCVPRNFSKLELLKSLKAVYIYTLFENRRAPLPRFFQEYQVYRHE